MTALKTTTNVIPTFLNDQMQKTDT